MFHNSFYQQNGGGQFQNPINSNPHNNQQNGLNLDANGFEFMTGFDALSPSTMDMNGLASNMSISNVASDQGTLPATQGVSNLIARFENPTGNHIPLKRKPTSPQGSQPLPPRPPQPTTAHVMMQKQQQSHQPMSHQQRHMSQSSQTMDMTMSSPVHARESALFYQNQAAELGAMAIKQESFGLALKPRQGSQQFPVNINSPSNIMASSTVNNPSNRNGFNSMLGAPNDPFSPILSSPQAQIRSPVSTDTFAALNSVRITSPLSADQVSYGMTFTNQTATPISPTNVNIFGDVKTPSQEHVNMNAVTSPFNNIQSASSFPDPFGQDLISFASIDGSDMNGMADNGLGTIDNTAFMNDRMRTDSLSYQMNSMPVTNNNFFMGQQQQNNSVNPTQPQAPSLPQSHQHSRFPGSMPTPEPSNSSTPGFNIWKPPVHKTPKAPPLPTRPSTAVAPQFLTAQKTAGGDTIMGQPIPILQQQIQQQQQQQTSEETPPKKPPRPKPMSMSKSPIDPAPPINQGSSNAPALRFSSHETTKEKPAPPPRPTSSKPTREQVPAETWENHKTLIRQLYLDERRPLKEVMQLMADRHNFRATPKMYKTRFSQWGFAKNNTEEEVKRLLSIKFQRDAEGKTSEFVRNGRVVNIRTYLKRKGKTEYDLYDFEAHANLPGHTRCRTPPPLPNLPGHMAADVKRFQEVITGNMHKALLMCKESQANTTVPWSSTMLWGAVSSDIIWSANEHMKRGAPDRGVAVLNDAFSYLNNELKSMSPQVIKELLLGLVNGDPAMVTALSKFFSAWTAKHLERSHPLRPIFTALYSILQEHGAQTLSDLIWTTMPSFIDDLEAIYGRKHPYVAGSLLDLLELAEEQHLRLQHLQPDQTLEEYRSRVTHLITELHPVLENIESVEGIQSTDATALRYMLLQMQHSVMPGTSTTHVAAADLYRQMRQTGRLFQIQYAAAGLFCYHEPIKVTPSMRRCRHRYDSVAKLLQMHENLAISFYFEEDMHNADHALTNSDVSHHLPYNGNAGGGSNGNNSGNGNGNGSNAALAAALEMQTLGGGLGGGFAWS